MSRDMAGSMNTTQSENFTRLKEEQGVSQRKLAEMLGKTERTVSDWCSGKKTISRSNAQQIAEVYPEYPVAWLRGETRYKNRAEEFADELADFSERGKEKRALFELLSKMCGWNVVWSLKDAPSTAAPFTGCGEHFDMSEDRNVRNDNYIRIAKGARVVTVDRFEVESFAAKLLDYFDFELAHTVFESEKRQALKEHGLED